jgi:hypothetical protein
VLTSTFARALPTIECKTEFNLYLPPYHSLNNFLKVLQQCPGILMTSFKRRGDPS